MKKIVILLIGILMFLGCANNSKKVKSHKIKKYDLKRTNLKKDVRFFKEEVFNLKAISEDGKVKLSWNLKNLKNLKNIKISYKEENKKHWQHQQNIGLKNMIEIKVPSLTMMKFRVQLISKQNRISKGKIIKKAANAKNVILDNISTIHNWRAQIYLPDNYNNSKKRYPVVYLGDGNNIFSTVTSLSPIKAEWKVDEMLERLKVEKKIEDLIVVAIVPYNTRERFPDENLFVDEILPYIDNNYRTIANRENRAIMGSSGGASYSLEIGYKYNNLFSMIGLLSLPCFESNIDLIKNSPKKNLKIWLSVGTDEMESDSYLKFDRRALDMFLKKGYKLGKDIVYYELKDGRHNEKAWGDIIEYPFIFFKGKKAKKIKKMGIQLELINSKSHWLLLNPQITLDNGLKYSLYNSAKYKIIENGKGGEVNSKGNFIFGNRDKTNVEITYKDKISKIEIDYNEFKEKLEKGIYTTIKFKNKNGKFTIKGLYLDIRRVDNMDYINFKSALKLVKEVTYPNIKYIEKDNSIEGITNNKKIFIIDIQNNILSIRDKNNNFKNYNTSYKKIRDSSFMKLNLFKSIFLASRKI
ncbi:alpha/beta hydrolase [Haliovirga abyssi]|uniref:Esterase family protein n=1 Tax=Haliovirga abyssi TaxID=2996794 RepID=A0AAU9DAM8_9FUSO|nr:alpha/beta hydrolase-fold protein [Haliovirga abyssi]BDU51708.1 hypothetical protein HLVA_22770 [Haliovirga abyssi]